MIKGQDWQVIREWGRIGASMRSERDHFSDYASAKKYYDAQIKKRTKRGYIQTEPQQMELFEAA